MVKTLKISARFKLEVFDPEGRRIAKVSKPANLILGNVHKILGLLFGKEYAASFLPVNSVYPSFPDSGNTLRAGNRLRSRDNAAIDLIYNENYSGGSFNYVGVGYVLLGLGVGTTEPTLQDYALANEVASASSPARVVSVLSDGRFKIDYSYSFTFTTAKDITEAGIWFYFYVHAETGNAYGGKWVMLARDVFTAKSVPAGGSVAVQYSFIV